MVGEGRFIQFAARQGWDIYRGLDGHTVYDFIVDAHPGIHRVEVKRIESVQVSDKGYYRRPPTDPRNRGGRMTNGKPFRLGEITRWGETTCGFGVDLPMCDKPATVHVMWLESSATSSTCDEHMAFIAKSATFDYETHTFGGDCGMPGSLWHHPYEDEDEGYCHFPAPDDASLVIEEIEPAPRFDFLYVSTPTGDYYIPAEAVPKDTLSIKQQQAPESYQRRITRLGKYEVYRVEP